MERWDVSKEEPITAIEREINMEPYIREYAVEEGPMDDFPYFEAAVKLLKLAEPSYRFRQGELAPDGMDCIILLHDAGIRVWPTTDADPEDGGGYVTFNQILHSLGSPWRFRSPVPYQADKPQFNEMLICLRCHDEGDPELQIFSVI